MPRPRKWRKVGYVPTNNVFGPLQCGNSNREVINMEVEELESLRLMDLEGYDQIKCAQLMGIARSTFQRIYSSAKGKVADSIVNGKVLKIEGGNYTLNICKMVCKDCGYVWDESFENVNNEKVVCPKCGSEAEVKCDCSIDESGICHRCRRGRGRGCNL
ncbi:DUF134 domain-containing protein [Haloimpatiens sp. FM7330]|uniref:DUF134 domain-containing protein n=1 Tax=Haloimpatiens sp. FM7330 TaxID=3298610 RepID=UPI0036458B73